MDERHPIEQIQLAPLRRLSSSLDHLIATQLWARVLIGMTAGIGVGAALGLALGLVVQPGRFLDAAIVRAAMASEVVLPSEVPAPPGLDRLPEVVIGLLPTNPLASMVGREAPPTPGPAAT